MGFFNQDEDDSCLDEELTSLSWDLKSEEFISPPVRARSNTINSCGPSSPLTVDEEESGAPVVAKSRVIFGTASSPALLPRKPVEEEEEFEFRPAAVAPTTPPKKPMLATPVREQVKEEEEEVEVEDVIVIVEEEVASKEVQTVVVEEEEEDVESEQEDVEMATPRKPVPMRTPPPKPVPMVRTPPPKQQRALLEFDDIRLYNYCWPKLKKTEQWTARPGGDGLSTSWTYLAPGVKRANLGVLGETVFKSERALMRHVQQAKPQLFAEAAEAVYLEMEEEDESDSGSSSGEEEVMVAKPIKLPPTQTPSKKPAKTQPTWTEIWNQCLELGWTVRAGTGLESWRFVLPHMPGKQYGVDYFCTREEVTARVAPQQQQPPKEEEKGAEMPPFEQELWPHLSKKLGWRYTTGRGVVEYIYYLPHGKSKRKGGELGKDYLHSKEEVEAYCRQHAQETLSDLLPRTWRQLLLE